MRPAPEPLLAVVARSLLAFVATFVTLLSWQGLSELSSGFLLPLFWAGLGLLLGGALVRALGVPELAVALGQVVLAAAGVTHWLAPRSAVAGWVPTSRTVEAIGLRLQGSVETANNWAAPIPVSDAASFAPLMVVAGVAVFLLVDLFLGVARRAPLVGLPLLAAFTAPVSVLHGVSWIVFSVAALAFLLMLAVDQALRLSRWGSALPASPTVTTAAGTGVGAGVGTGPGAVTDDQPHRVRVGTLWPAASRLAVAGVGLAVVAPALLPATSGLFDTSPGTGPGDGGLSLQNPLVDMRRDLSRGEDRPMVVVRTDDPAPAYLRTTVLDEFDGQAWRPSERELPREQRVLGDLPAPPGLRSSAGLSRYRSSIRVLPEFDTTWLPTPYPTESVAIEGDWRYDLSTLDILSSDPDVDASGLDYDVVGLEVSPDAATLVEAPPVPQPIYVPMTDLPGDLPSRVSELARELTADGQSQFEKAVTLQDWFREDGGFTYSVRRDPGSGNAAILKFLSDGEDGKTGYCEQFASAMAIMSRAIGIPARVAVGFLRPEQQGDGSWVYSSHDLHAWPELYFEGTGWIRFEPTPRDETGGGPGYTQQAIPAPAAGGPTGSVQEDDPKPLPEPGTTEKDAPGASSTTADEGLSPWLLLIPGVLLMGVLGAAPRVLRGWTRRRRLAADAAPGERVEGAWAELRATAVDLGLGWDDGATLRQRARALATPLAGDRDALARLETAVLGVERSRFSRHGVAGPVVDAVVTGVVQVCGALERSVSDRTRRRALWLPASLWRGRRRPLTAPGDLGTGAVRAGAASRRDDTELVSV